MNIGLISLMDMSDTRCFGMNSARWRRVDFILSVGRYRLGYADQLLHIVIVLWNRVRIVSVALFYDLNSVLHFLGGAWLSRRCISW